MVIAEAGAGGDPALAGPLAPLADRHSIDQPPVVVEPEQQGAHRRGWTRNPLLNQGLQPWTAKAGAAALQCLGQLVRPL